MTKNVYAKRPKDVPISTSYDANIGGITIAEQFSRLLEDKSATPFNEYFDDTITDLMHGIDLPEAFSMIDEACGDGKTLSRIGRTFTPKPGTLRGFDLSLDMVRIANQKHTDIPIVQADMRTILPEEHDSVDLITCINAVHYLPTLVDVFDAYSTAYRLLKPGGHLLIVTGDHDSTAAWRQMSEEQLRQWIEDGRKPMNWGMPDKQGNILFRLAFYPYFNEEHADALAGAGFEQINMYRRYPPRESMIEYSPEVFHMLRTDSLFVFFDAQKPLDEVQQTTTTKSESIVVFDR